MRRDRLFPCPGRALTETATGKAKVVLSLKSVGALVAAKKKKKSGGTVALAAVLFLFAWAAGSTRVSAQAQIDESNLGGRWYNLPPVSRSAMGPVLGCLQASGLPYPSFAIGQTGGVSQVYPPPAHLVFALNGRTHEADAVLTFYAPLVTYVETAQRLLGLTPGQGTLNEINRCLASKAVPLTVVRPNPLGEQQAGDWCQSRLKTLRCWQGNQGDQFLPGDAVTVGGVEYKKYRGGWFFLTWSAWAMPSEVVQ